MSACPDENELGRFVQGLLTGAEETPLQEHLEGCPTCFALVAEIARTFVTAGSGACKAGPELPPLTPGRRVFGRYEVVGVLGQGGMGTVFEAKDAATRRRVAIKILHYGPSDADARVRLLREARAMARLSHPNVVQVFDVGQDAGETFMVTELVDGTTLDRWIERERPPWRVVVRAFIGIARGLDAAHAVGLVHRDVKPHNVLVDRSGTPRVMDLGLARFGPQTLSASSGAPSSLTGPSSETLAPGGALVGTPAYMSPEQLRGEPASPASDEFSLCVMLYEALCGHRPFSGNTIATLLDATMGGTRPWPAALGVPRRIRTAVDRGLNPTPDHRWPSVASLAATLERGLRTRADRFVLLAATGGFVGLAVGIGSDDGSPPCPDEPGIDAHFTPELRAGLRESFTRSSLMSAGEQWVAVETVLDDYVERWTDVRTDVCTGRAEPDVISEQLACLRLRSIEFAETISALGRDSTALARAQAAVRELQPPSTCVELPEPVEATDPEQTAIAAALRGRLASVDALNRVGRLEDAQAEARRVVRDAGRADLTLLQGQAHLRSASSLDKLGRYHEAIDEAQAAMFTAIAVGDDELLLQASSLLTFVAGRLDLREEGDAWGRQAEATSERLGRPPLLEADRLHSTGTFLLTTGRPAKGRELLLQSAELRRGTLGPKHPKYASALANIAIADEKLGDLSAQREHATQALEIRRHALGPDHPDLATSINNLGVAYYDAGMYLEARALYLEALEIRRRVLGPEHPMTATCAVNLGNVEFSLGDFGEAVARFDQASPVFEKSLGADHPKSTQILANASRTLSRLGRFDEAIARAQRAVTAIEGARGTEDVATIEAYNALGFALGSSGRLREAQATYRKAVAVGERIESGGRRQVAESSHMLGVFLYSEGRVEEAIPSFEAALAAYETELGLSATEVGNLHTAIGASLADRGDFDRGLQHLERALAITESKTGMPDDLAATRAYLAYNILRAHRDRKPDRERALHLLELARDHYSSVGERAAKDLAEIEAMLAPYGR